MRNPGAGLRRQKWGLGDALAGSALLPWSLALLGHPGRGMLEAQPDLEGTPLTPQAWDVQIITQLPGQTIK